MITANFPRNKLYHKELKETFLDSLLEQDVPILRH